MYDALGGFYVKILSKNIKMKGLKECNLSRECVFVSVMFTMLNFCGFDSTAPTTI